MKLQDALDHLQNGGKIRRKYWGADRFIFIDGYSVRWENGWLYSFMANDIWADDWEIVEDQPKPDLDSALDQVKQEFERITKLHPAPNPNLAVLMEEVGEVAKACQEGDKEAIKAEAIQVAAVALRIVMEGL